MKQVAEAIENIVCISHVNNPGIRSEVSIRLWWVRASPEASSTPSFVYDEWLTGRLKILPKKGDLSDPNSWRGIMLLDAASKILSSILSERLQDLLREEGLEEQCGFTVKRGCSDGSFILRMALQKRHEHNQDSWAVFVDLVKAFDTVDRDGMVAVKKKTRRTESLL